VVGLHGRTVEPGITAGTLPSSLSRATVVIVTVRDAQLEAALAELGAVLPNGDVVVLHASGSMEPEGLDALRRRGHACGTLHPLVPLADPARAPELLQGAWIGIDGDPAARATAARLASRLGAHTLAIPAGEKPRYHAAAVFAANFPTVLAAIAEGLLERCGVSPADSRAAVERLMAAAVENLRAGTPERMLTGPVVRGDVAAVDRHLAVLGDDPVALEAYVALTHAAAIVASRGGATNAALERFANLTVPNE
jgi:predicted short-subunit dehydrogenase-like oxidoreductase (DUF2520 family)